MVARDDVITLRGAGPLEAVFGCTAGENKGLVHLGFNLIFVTACGKPTEDIMVETEVRVDCPECVAEVRYRKQNPEAAKENPGVVTHRQE